MKTSTIQDKLLKNLSGEDRNSLALEYGDSKISYYALSQKSNSVCAYILSKGIRKGTPIAVLTDDKIELITLMLGVFMAGCVFVPLDSQYPANRIKIMLLASSSKYLFYNNINGILIDDIMAGLEETEAVNTEVIPYDMVCEKFIVEYSPEDMVYIYFTSGTTGEPKAIAGQNKGLLHFIEWEIDTFNIHKECRISQLTPQCHDPYLRDVLVPLCAGGVVCIPERKEICLNTDSLIKWIDRSQINLIHCTPSLFRIFNSNQLTYSVFSNLKYILLAGEKIIPYELINWYKIFDNRIQLVNLYGPTETTLAKMYHVISMDDCNQSSIPIGRPISGCRVIILNDHMKVCNQGEVGEIYIRTPYKTLGYLNDETLMKQRFIQNPFNEDPNDIIYRTGDLGRVLWNGNIEFAGRMDRQVKIRGHRVEVGEIENQLIKHPDIQACTVNYEQNENLSHYQHKTQYCKLCGLTSDFPDTTFNENGICNICQSYTRYKSKVDYYFKTEDDLYEMFKSNRKKRKGEYDCLMLFSGGKDSTYALYKLVDMGLKVLVYTFDNGFISEAALLNINRIVNELNVDHVIDRYDKMNSVFCKGLEEETSVCNGCFKVLRIKSTKLAYEKGIKYIVTGFSRGQIFELRLGSIFKNDIFSEEEIQSKILEQRILYHSKLDYVTEVYGEDKVAGYDILVETEIIDFYRYSNIKQEDIYKYLEARSSFWATPKDTGFCSSNCRINDVGIYLQRKEKHYDNYTLPNSWEVRTGHISLEKSMAEYETKIDAEKVKDILNELGYEEKYLMKSVSEGYLSAYYISDKNLSETILRQYMENNLPDYMVPSFYVRLDEIPLTANGKVNYKELPNPRKLLKNSYIGARDQVESKLVEVWCEILKIEKVGIDENFHKIGGHSLNIMALISKVSKAFDVDYPLSELFTNVTIEKMAEYIRNDKNYKLKMERSKKTKLAFPLLEAADYKYQNEKMLGQLKKEQNIHKLHETFLASQNAYSFTIKENISETKVIDNIIPYNDIFFKGCVYNSFLPVMQYLGKNKISVLINDIISYSFDKSREDVRYGVGFSSYMLSDELFEEIGLGYEGKAKCKDIVSNILAAINNNRPVIINLDCYYLSIRPDMYLKHNWPHFLLIYGYNQQTEMFNVIEHTQVDSLTYRPRECSFQDIHNSYNLYLHNFARSEELFTYFEFFNLDETRSDSLEDCILIYKRNMLEYRHIIYKGLDNLKAMIEYFIYSCESEDKLSSQIEGILFMINNIVNAKNSEYYIITSLFPENSFLVNTRLNVVKNWKYIRAILKKYQITNEYRSESIKLLNEKYYDIDKFELNYYDSLFSYIK